MVKLPADMKNYNTHNEYTDENIEQNPKFDKHRLLLRQSDAKGINAILKDDIANYLC